VAGDGRAEASEALSLLCSAEFEEKVGAAHKDTADPGQEVSAWEQWEAMCGVMMVRLMHSDGLGFRERRQTLADATSL